MQFSYKTSIVFLIAAVFLAYANTAYSQNDSVALANADTSYFSINVTDGWLLYNSYATQYETDSARLEIIIRHQNNINWTEEHYIGKIKSEVLRPQNMQTAVYWLLNDQYGLRIDETGKCYLRLLSGNPPSANPVVLPLMFSYKK